MITVAYMTSRKDPRLEWFLDAFHNQTGGNYNGVRVVVVDFYANDDSRAAYFGLFGRINEGGADVIHRQPKPNVWQGKHRLTREDYFAAANARNTALCLAPDGHIVFVDDLSVPLPGWWDAVQIAAKKNDTVTLGAYEKVKDLSVKNGNLEGCTMHAPGIDMRRRDLKGEPPYPCMPGWHFGCSVCAPVEAYLSINGWPEACDGLGYEDCVTGIAMANRGWRFVYDTRMMTFESEELHSQLPVLKRWDKGVSPNDKSHAMLLMYRNVSRFDNYFGPEGIRGLRARVLSGDPFPMQQIPEHDWYDGQPLREM